MIDVVVVVAVAAHRRVDSGADVVLVVIAGAGQRGRRATGRCRSRRIARLQIHVVVVVVVVAVSSGGGGRLDARIGGHGHRLTAASGVVVVVVVYRRAEAVQADVDAEADRAEYVGDAVWTGPRRGSVRRQRRRRSAQQRRRPVDTPDAAAAAAAAAAADGRGSWAGRLRGRRIAVHLVIRRVRRVQRIIKSRRGGGGRRRCRRIGRRAAVDPTAGDPVASGDAVLGVVVLHQSGAVQVRQRTDLVAQDPRNGTNRRNVVFVADAVGQQPVADLPCEDARVFALQLFNVTHHLRFPSKMVLLSMSQSLKNVLSFEQKNIPFCARVESYKTLVSWWLFTAMTRY